MAELKNGDRVEHKSGGLATVTRAECNDAGNPNCAMILFDSGPWPDPVTALKCNLIPIGKCERFAAAKRVAAQSSTAEHSLALRRYDLPTARDAQRRAILLKEMSRPVKGDK